MNCNPEKEVYFHKYCPHCENFDKPEADDPCDECLECAVNTYSHKPVCYKGPDIEEDHPGSYIEKHKIKDFLHAVGYEYQDYEFAKRYFRSLSDNLPRASIGNGGCSVVRKGNFVGKNYDWTYSNQAEFVVCSRPRNRYKSIGIAGSISKLTDAFVSSGKYDELYRIVPFQIQDGMNERGLFVGTNVVPTDKGTNISVPFTEKLDSISGLMLSKYILDNFWSARDAVSTIQNYVEVYFPKALHDMGYEMHFLIADEYDTFALEFVDNKAVVIDISDKPYLTNFYIHGVTFNSDGKVYTPVTQSGLLNAFDKNHITLHGSGLERYNYIVDNYHTADGKDGMRQLMNRLKYTRAYDTSPNPSNPYWYTEFVGERNLTVKSEPREFADVVNIAGGYFTERNRNDGKTWQTVHSSVYDLKNRKLYLMTQEDGEEITFRL